MTSITSFKKPERSITFYRSVTPTPFIESLYENGFLEEKDLKEVSDTVFFNIEERGLHQNIEFNTVYRYLKPNSSSNVIERIPQSIVKEDEGLCKLLDFPSFTQPTFIREVTQHGNLREYFIDNFHTFGDYFRGNILLREELQGKEPQYKSSSGMVLNGYLNSIYGNENSQISVVYGEDKIESIIGKSTLEDYKKNFQRKA